MPATTRELAAPLSQAKVLLKAAESFEIREPCDLQAAGRPGESREFRSTIAVRTFTDAGHIQGAWHMSRPPVVAARIRQGRRGTHSAGPPGAAIIAAVKARAAQRN